MRSRITIQYPFHPHRGVELEVVQQPRRTDAPITVVDPDGAHLKVPAWMLSCESAGHSLSAEAAVDPRALLELDELLSAALDRVRRER